MVGLAVGLAVGFMVGLAVGLAVGFMVGLAVGLAVGFMVGLAVGLEPVRHGHLPWFNGDGDCASLPPPLGSQSHVRCSPPRSGHVERWRA